MARLPRWIPDNSLVELSNRCTQGRFLLRPSRELDLAIAGVLARAMELYPVVVHALSVLSNHYHMLATCPSTGVMSDFMKYFDRNVSIEVGKLYGWRGSLWQGRFHHAIVDDDPAIQIERLRYVLAQGVKEGLVYSPLEWPGINSARQLISGEPLRGHWIDRTGMWAAKNRRKTFDINDFIEETSVEFQPLPCWAHLDPAAVRLRVADLVAQIERLARQAHERAGTRPVGVRKVLARPPHFCPPKVKWSPGPRVFAANTTARWRLWRALQSVVAAYWQASRDYANGMKNVVFPEGTFPPGGPYVLSRADQRLGLV